MKLEMSGLRRLLAITIATAILSVVITGAVAYWGMVRLDVAAHGMRHGDTALANAAEDMREDVLELRRYEKDVFMNVGADDLVRQYKEKWDRALLLLRYDLQRARRTDSTSQEELQKVTDRIAAYSVAFGRIYDSIANGTIRTTQQANDEMSLSKESVRDAEGILADIGSQARHRQPLLRPVIVAQQFGLAVSLISFLVLAVLCVSLMRRLPAAKYV
jgi:methyl-accepting chemotaxis protein